MITGTLRILHDGTGIPPQRKSYKDITITTNDGKTKEYRFFGALPSRYHETTVTYDGEARPVGWTGLWKLVTQSIIPVNQKSLAPLIMHARIFLPIPESIAEVL